MSFILEALRDRPYRLYLADTALPWTDYSGNGIATAISDDNSTSLHTGLVAGARTAEVLASGVRYSTPANIYKAENDGQTFSVEAWLKPISTDGTWSQQQICGNLDRFDGLIIEGTKVSFVEKFITAPVFSISYDLQTNRAFHVVAVHTQAKNSLYVNGVLVAEGTLSIEQQADTIVSGSASLHGGATSGTSRVAINGLGIYDHALTQESITRHYRAGIRGPGMDAVAASGNAKYTPVSLASRALFMDRAFDTDEDWQDAQMNNVVVSDGALKPQFLGSTSLASSWTTVISLSDANAVSIYGVQLDWDGINVVIETSLNGTSWTAEKRGVNIANIPSGYNPTDKILYLRARFPGGITNDPAVLDRLVVTGLSTGFVQSQSARDLTFTKTYPEREFRVREFNENWGAQIDSGGSILVSADTSSAATPMRTIEMWVRQNSATALAFSVAGTSYYNGGDSSALVKDQWTLVHFVASANITGPLTISNAAQVGGINIYDNVLSTAQILAIYQQYTMSDALRAVDGSVIGLIDSNSSVSIYAHDWSVQVTG